jgi:hypothetical protein
MQSTALASRLRHKASDAIPHALGARLYDVAPPASLAIESRPQTEAAPWRRSLLQYITGWAQADPAMIAGAVIEEYRFHDPLVGMFTGKRLPRYFALLDARFAAGLRAQAAFYLHGPMDGCVQGELVFFREAPQLGLTGIARILIGTRGVMAETVAYDLNMATELLRGPHSDAAD